MRPNVSPSSGTCSSTHCATDLFQAQAFHPQILGFSESDSLPSMYLSEGSSGLMGDEGIQAFSNTNTSLLRALESEQEAHRSTKSQFEQESNARCEAEAETRRLAEHNKGLLNSIKLLQSTVKHMTQKENLPTTPVKEIVTSAVRLDVTQADNAGANNSILYDVLSNYKVPHKTVTDGEETTSVINLDLLSTPDSKDKSDRAHIQRTLRRQMGLSSDHEEEAGQNGNIHKKEAPLLPDIGEEPIEVFEMERNSTSVNDRQSQPDETPVTVNHARPQTPEQTAPSSDFVYDLPAAFLNKYGKKPADAPEALKLVAEVRELPPPQTPRKAGLTVSSAVKARDIENDPKPPSRVVYMPDSPMINWKIDGRHMDELRRRPVETKFQSHFTEHPIRYGK